MLGFLLLNTQYYILYTNYKSSIVHCMNLFYLSGHFSPAQFIFLEYQYFAF